MDGVLVDSGRKVYYMDETWVNKNHHHAFSWKKLIEVGKYADPDGKVNKLPCYYDGDMDLPSGKGERLIILHFSE